MAFSPKIRLKDLHCILCFVILTPYKKTRYNIHKNMYTLDIFGFAPGSKEIVNVVKCVVH